jgi:hypothetical protein
VGGGAGGKPGIKTPGAGGGAKLFDPVQAAVVAQKTFNESKDPQLRKEATDALNALVRFSNQLKESDKRAGEVPK